MRELLAIFQEVEDPRRGNAKRHDLHEMLVIALLSTLTGGRACVEMADYGCAAERWLRTFLALKNGIPSHDTFSRLFRLLNPAGLQTALLRLAQDWADRLGGVVAVDGKVLKRSFEDARPRRQAPRTRRLPQHQEPRVVPDHVQTPELHRAMPPQPTITRPALERPGLPAHQRHPMAPPLRHMPQTAPRELLEPHAVVLRHQSVPPPALVRPRRTHHHLPNHHVQALRPRSAPLHAPLDTPSATRKPVLSSAPFFRALLSTTSATA